MIAVDTTVLVYAHLADSKGYGTALRKGTKLAEGRGPRALPWPCLHEFVAIATHPRIYSPPSLLGEALRQMHAWIESPTVVMLAEQDHY